MNAGLSRRRRPPPIEIPKIERRQLSGGNGFNPPPKATPSPKATGSRFSSSQRILQPTITVIPTPSPRRSTIAIVQPATSILSSPRQTTTLLQPTSTLQTLAQTSAVSSSPTKTTFVTVTASLKSPKEKAESPTRTVYLSAPPQIVTVTAAPAGATLQPPQPEQQGTNALPQGAKVPIIVISVIAGLAAIFTVAIILWRKKKRKAEAKMASEQSAMAEVDEGGFRAIPDTRPILARTMENPT